MARRQNVDNAIILRAARQAELSASFLVLMGVSGVLAAISFATNSIPLLLGSMVIAPVFPPLVLFIMGFSGGQEKLALRGLGTALLGIVVATVCATLASLALAFFDMVESRQALLASPLLEERVRPGVYSILAAVAAGIAGTVGYVRNKTDTLIGTVASVALVPAAGAAGISFAGGDPLRALGGAVLLVMNLIAIVATGLLSVVVMRPRAEHEEPQSAQSQ